MKLNYFFISFFISILSFSFCIYSLSFANGLNFSIAKVKSGIVAIDSFNEGNKSSEFLRWKDTHNWNFEGLQELQNDSNNFYEDKNGLHLGINSSNPGQWTAFFASSLINNSQLFHIHITSPYSMTKDNKFITMGLEVYPSTGLVNYITCFANVGPKGLGWEVHQIVSNTAQQIKDESLWISNNFDQQHSKDCTIITNGNNYLKVYINNILVYSNSNLNLQMIEPFKVLLKVSTSSTHFIYGEFKDYYITSDQSIKVINAPLLGSIKIVQPSSNSVITSATVDSNGMANIEIGQYHFPLNAQIIVYNAKKNIVTFTPRDTSLYGGDIYSVNMKK